MKDKIFSQQDIKSFVKFYEYLGTFAEHPGIIGLLKREYFSRFGLKLKKSLGRGDSRINFGIFKKNSLKGKSINISLNNPVDHAAKLAVANLILSSQEIQVVIENSKSLNPEQRANLQKYIDQFHPEAMLLLPICQGKGVDVGCGFRKTHPRAIGVDWIPRGKMGRAGVVKGKIMETDIQAHGDNLYMFKDNSLDYLVARHNLEHYKKPNKTLREWVRVLKNGSLIGVVVPNYKNPQTYEETHYYDFDQERLKQLFEDNGSIDIISIGPAVPNWSFYCIGRKKLTSPVKDRIRHPQSSKLKKRKRHSA